MNENWFLSELGRRIRRQRERKGFSLSELAERSELSRRYLTETEAGRANPSIIKLASVARALRLSLAELCDLPLEENRGRRIALVGFDQELHMAVGRKLAFEVERPLVSLDKRIASKSGLTIAEVQRRASEEWLREPERDALEDYLVHDGDSILVTGPFLFQRKATWDRLLESTFTVWLRAGLDDHWDRVLASGHTGGLRTTSMNKTQIAQALKEREPAYSRAHLTLNTPHRKADELVASIMSAAL